MIARIFDFALKQRMLVFLGIIALTVAGVWSAVRLPMDAVPDITNVQVQINTSVAALAPEEIEKQITFPIETEMQGLQGLVEMRSISRFGLSQVTLVFDDHTGWSFFLCSDAPGARRLGPSDCVQHLRVGNEQALVVGKWHRQPVADDWRYQRCLGQH